MKASELIEKLQDAIKEHGDIKVGYFDDFGGIVVVSGVYTNIAEDYITID